jgi:hypothetical protein
VDYDEFIGRVQSRGDMSSRGEAERAVRAVLTALGEHLDESEADKLASRLPREVSGYLRQERTEHGPVLLLPVFHPHSAPSSAFLSIFSSTEHHGRSTCKRGILSRRMLDFARRGHHSEKRANPSIQCSRR